MLQRIKSMKGISFAEMLKNVGDLEKIAEALTPQQAMAIAEEESTPKGGAKKFARRAAAVGALAGAIEGGLSSGSPKVKALKAAWNAIPGAVVGGAAGGAVGYVANKIYEEAKLLEKYERANEFLRKTASMSMRDAISGPTTFTSSTGQKTVINHGKRKSVKQGNIKGSKVPKSNLGQQFAMGNTSNNSFFGGKVATSRKKGWLGKGVGEFLVDAVKGIVKR